VGHLRFGYCFDSKVRPGAPHSLKEQHSQSNLKAPQTLATAKILTHFIISIAVLENVCPLTQGYRKESIVHTKLRSGRSTCIADSVSRRSAIHYAYEVFLCVESLSFETSPAQPMLFSS
jgi:hypothetical protein